MCAQRRLRSAWASTQSDQSLHCPHEETWVLSYSLSGQRRLRSDWADLSLHWLHSHFVGFVMRQLTLNCFETCSNSTEVCSNLSMKCAPYIQWIQYGQCWTDEANTGHFTQMCPNYAPVIIYHAHHRCPGD